LDFYCQSSFWTLRKSESVYELLCDMEESPSSFSHIGRISWCIQSFFFYGFHMCRIFCIFSVSCIMYFKFYIELIILSSSGVNNARINIPFCTSVFDRVIDQLISDKNKSPSPWTMDVMLIKYSTDKITKDLRLFMIRSEFYMKLDMIDICE